MYTLVDQNSIITVGFYEFLLILSCLGQLNLASTRTQSNQLTGRFIAFLSTQTRSRCHPVY
jgi:hypothetical protein